MNSNPYSSQHLLAELFPPDDPEEAESRPSVAPPAPSSTRALPKRAKAAAEPEAPKAPGDEAVDPGGPSGDRVPKGRVVAVVIQKGGVGKTTTTINLGAALAEEGARVLLVDFDPQGALSVGLGLNPNEIEVSVYNLLLDRTVGLQEVVSGSSVPSLDVVPSNIDLSAAEVVLVTEVAREHLLKRCLEPARKIYDYILIDCPPSLGLLTVNALTAAHSVIIPLECEYFALRGMALLMDTVAKVQERLNPELEVLGIVATMLEARTIHGREVLSRVGDAFGDKLFKTVIHKTIKFAEAPVAGIPILSYAPNSNGAQEYRDLGREVMVRAS
ncbi:MAG TPA: ParA family protein [Actinomycetota bacterium]|nr:ParA family protein [Actinomycetota bacterium]